MERNQRKLLVRLTNDEKQEVRRKLAEGQRVTDLAKYYNVSKGTISGIKNEKKTRVIQDETPDEGVDMEDVAGEQNAVENAAEIHNLRTENALMKTEIICLKQKNNELNQKLTMANSQVSSLEERVANLQQQLSNCNSELRQVEQWRKKLHNEVLELKGNIRIFCRVRPHQHSGKMSTVSFGEDQQQLVVNQPTLNNKPKQTVFFCNKVFKPECTQMDIFEEVSLLVQSSLDGYNVCVFTYGHTGSGKTYTMEGTNDDKGVIARALCQIFKSVTALNQRGWQYVLKASYLEIYNDTICDLLCKGSDSTPHEIKMVDGKNDVYVTNINIIEVFSEDEIGKLLKMAQRQRAVASTKSNNHSSRSHSVFQLSLNGKNETTGESHQGSLNLVDLTGSERLKESGSEVDRQQEAIAINKSLCSLGQVFKLLSERASHIPYRDSKLTYLLKNSLCRNSKTLMFVNISPEEEMLNETLSSLRFAKMVYNPDVGVAPQKK